MRRFSINRSAVPYLAIDTLLIVLSLSVAFVVRLGFPIDADYLGFLRLYTLPIVILKLTIFYLFRLYHRMWRYAGTRELRAVIEATMASSAAVLFLSFILQTTTIPRTVFVVDWLLTLILVGGSRLAPRSLSELTAYGDASSGAKRVLVVGAGDAGELLVRELLKNRAQGLLPIGFIDDDPGKRRLELHGLKVLGTRRELPGILAGQDIDEVVIAMPSASRDIKEAILSDCERANTKCRTVPGLFDLVSGRVNVSNLRNVEIEDVLGREPVKVELQELSAHIAGRTVLVTGAGGSIGSELCRQASTLKPALLIMVDIAENSLFEIEQELIAVGGSPLMTVVADVKDEDRMDEILQAYHPQIVFHAAAYKHVPMMEMNPRVALENNFIGTQVIAEAAIRHHVKEFVLISTDKAVNPLSVMGLSKALAEKAVLSLGGRRHTKLMIVRFGNVLASSGSVVPTFKQQISRGGPVTITHPDMKRYFMTITEAVQLVIQASALGESGQVFVLDMGEPIKIVDLAKKMIKLYAPEPDKIAIDFIGLRSGEKLEEELFRPREQRLKTEHEKILLAVDSEADPAALAPQLEEIEGLIKTGQMRPAFNAIRDLFPETAAEEPQNQEIKVPADR
jgi:FlaA1/EpsC-like NDP-sugar epimerase